MSEKKDFSLVRKPSSAVEKAAPGAKRILSGMVADTLVLVKKARPLRIVVVDDEPMLLKLNEIIIHENFKNATVLTFDDGDRAWQEILRTAPDLLITDMARAGLNGWEMLPLLARNKVRFPILVTSGTADEKSVRQCAGSELNISFLAKPLLTEVFAKFLETTLNIPPDTERRNEIMSRRTSAPI